MYAINGQTIYIIARKMYVIWNFLRAFPGPRTVDRDGNEMV